MRPAPDAPAIHAPPFPRELTWCNVAPLRMDKQKGRVVLVEFFDFCRVNSLRTLPYMQAWHAKYGDRGLRVIGIHTGGFECSRDVAAVQDAVARLGIYYPVVIDERLELWDFYGNKGWPARYLWDRSLALHSLHYGEGAYGETEAEIQALLEIDDESLVAPVRVEDAPGTLLAAQSEDVYAAYSGPYEAGGVWAVCDGHGTLTVNGRPVRIDGPGCYELISHEQHTQGELSLSPGAGVEVLATCFTPGIARSPADA